MGSCNVTCHPTQVNTPRNPNQTGWCSITTEWMRCDHYYQRPLHYQSTCTVDIRTRLSFSGPSYYIFLYNLFYDKSTTNLSNGVWALLYTADVTAVAIRHGVSVHLDADVYPVCFAVDEPRICHTALMLYSRHQSVNWLKLNDEKTLFICLGSRRQILIFGGLAVAPFGPRLRWYCWVILSGGRFSELCLIYQGCRALTFALARLSCYL